MQIKEGIYRMPVEIRIDMEEFLLRYGESGDNDDVFTQIKEAAEDGIYLNLMGQGCEDGMEWETDDCMLILRGILRGSYREKYWKATRTEPEERDVVMDELETGLLEEYIMENLPEKACGLMKVLDINVKETEIEIEWF